MKMNFELTDTFGGEANYCWVRRESNDVPNSLSDLAIVRRAKAFAGFTGHPCRVEKYGEDLAIYPRGVCQVCFVSFDY